MDWHTNTFEVWMYTVHVNTTCGNFVVVYSQAETQHTATSPTVCSPVGRIRNNVMNVSQRICWKCWARIMIRRIWFKLYRKLLSDRTYRMAVIFVLMVLLGIYLAKKAGEKYNILFLSSTFFSCRAMCNAVKIRGFLVSHLCGFSLLIHVLKINFKLYFLQIKRTM